MSGPLLAQQRSIRLDQVQPRAARPGEEERDRLLLHLAVALLPATAPASTELQRRYSSSADSR